MTLNPSSFELEQLTPKEREALELVLRRMSSKEIGKALGLSPKTIDQRLDSARFKLGSATRLEAATRYAELAGIPERLPYQPFPVAEDSAGKAMPGRVPADAVYTLSDAMTFAPTPPWEAPSARNVPKFWERDLGTAPRIALILAGTAVVLILVLLGVGVAEGLEDLIRGG